MHALHQRGLNAGVCSLHAACSRQLTSVFCVQQQHLRTSSSKGHAQPQPQDPVASAASSRSSLELGAVRTNWRCALSSRVCGLRAAMTRLPTASVVCSRDEVAAVYNTPLLDLVYKAATVHRMYNDPQMVCCLCNAGSVGTCLTCTEGSC